MSRLGSRNVTRLHAHIPPAGGWIARCNLDKGAPPAPGPVTLTIGDLQIVGAVLPSRGGLDSPDNPAVVVAGGYGWHAPLMTAGKYRSASNVRLTTVIRDLAAAAVYQGGPVTGEAYVAPPEVFLGPFYGWEAHTPSRPVRGRMVLADLVARGAIPTWRVQPAGQTVFTTWPAAPAADAFGRIVDRNLARGLRLAKLDNAVAAWLPGATVQGVAIARVTFIEEDAELRAEVYEQ